MSIGVLKDEPFGTLTAVSGVFFHPESYSEGHLAELRDDAALPEEEQPPWVRKFKFEAREYLLGNTEWFDDDEFFRQVQFSDGRTEMFIRRAWAEVFSDEPIPGSPILPFDSIYTIAHIYFESVDPEDNYAHPDCLKSQLERDGNELSQLLLAIKPDLTRMLNGDFEGLDMVLFRSVTSSFYFHLREDDKDFARHVWRYLFPNEPLPESTT